MKRMLIAATTATLLAACGGGGGDDGTDNVGGDSGQQQAPVQAPVQAQQLGAYLGTWVADCDGRIQETATISRVSNDAVRIAATTDYYTGANCTGTVAATATHSADLTATYVSTADASVVIPPATTASTVKVDRVTGSIGADTVTFTGPGVSSRTNAAGQREWCISDGGAAPSCFADEGTRPAATATSYFTIRDNQLYELTPSGSTYTVNERLTKKS